MSETGAARGQSSSARDPDSTHANTTNATIHVDDKVPPPMGRQENEANDPSAESVETDITAYVSGDDSNEEDPTGCPICFQHEHLAVAPCQHVFCVPCMERLLLSAGHNTTNSGGRDSQDFVSSDYPAGRDQDIDQLRIPAWNACPICRQSIFLWDLRHYKDAAVSSNSRKGEGFAKNTSTGEIEKNQKCEEMEISCHDEPADDRIQTDFVYSRETPDWNSIPFLRGSVWLESSSEYAGHEGYGSFHFPPHVDDPDLTKPYYNLDNVHQKRLLLEDCMYHKDSRILSAQLRPEDEMSTDEATYRLVLAFSADGCFVRTGALVIQQPPLTPTKYTATFPYDGFYDFEEESVTVVGHRCLLNGQPLLLQKSVEVDEDYSSESLGGDDDDDKYSFPVTVLKLVTPNQRVLGTTDCTTGVGVGSQLVWNLKGSLSSTGTRRTWKWVRRAGPNAVMNRLPRSKLLCWGGYHARRWLRRQGPAPCQDGNRTGNNLPTYHGDSIWGNVYCQAFKVGLASYHFEKLSNDEESGRVYISYENPSTSEWPPLDNGQPIPAKVYFHNISFPTPTTFRGHILWLEDYGSPWQGMIRWEYEMLFDEKFTCIVGGSVTSFDMHAPTFPRELSRYGESLVYCNAALYIEYRRLVTEEERVSAITTSGDSTQDWSDRFRASSLELRLRLQREGASVRTIAMVHRIMTQAYQGETETSLIDYNMGMATTQEDTHNE